MAIDPLEQSFLTVAEVARILQLNEQTVRNWIDSGFMPAVRLGPRRVRIKRSDLERIIAEGYMPAVAVDSSDDDEAAVVSSLGNEALWHEFGVAADALADAIMARSPTVIADAFRALAKASHALGEAIAEKPAPELE